MNAKTQILPAAADYDDDEDYDYDEDDCLDYENDAAPEPKPPVLTNPYENLAPITAYGFSETRYDGWTPEKQRIFLQALSEGSSVKHACRIVGLSQQSAYAFRRRPTGAAFALGWQAAVLLGRDNLADELMDRALNGIFESTRHADGTSTERHRYDNRLSMAMLTRLDRLADSATREATHAAARLIAAEFDPYLDQLGNGPARAGLFLAARVADDADTDLAPVRALARADRWLRTGGALASEVDTADLDPAQRHGWTAEQWARAEAAGLLRLAEPEPEADSTGGMIQLVQPWIEPEDREEPVWWDEAADDWRTRFPPSTDFCGEEEGEFGDEGYARELSEDEAETMDIPHDRETAAREISEGEDRDAWFAARRAAQPVICPEGAAAIPS